MLKRSSTAAATNEMAEEVEEEEGYISIEQMTTMIDFYQSSSPFSSKEDSHAEVEIPLSSQICVSNITSIVWMQPVNMISVISILNYFLYVLQSNFIDLAIVKQFFEHTFSFIGISLNSCSGLEQLLKSVTRRLPL